MLEPLAIRILSTALAIVLLLGYAYFARKSRGGGTTRIVRASREDGVVVHQVWIFLALFPLAFFVVGAAVPSWVYGTPLNLAFAGGEIVQIAAVFLWVFGGGIALWSARTLGRFMVPEIEVRTDHELITGGPYARIRHPTYTAFLVMDVASVLLYFHAILVVAFLARLAIANARARREDELLASDDGFGERFREYMSRTGRFIPRRRRS